MDDIDQITALTHKINIDSDTTSAYETAFENIVCFVQDRREHAITKHELEVTKTLAAPFTRGGSLVLLLEPRRRHPWKLGADLVIRDCRTLRVMDDGFKLVSEGCLSFTKGVSVLDLRPFLVMDDYPQLECEVWEHLYDLVYKAIRAKEPDALLCMGNVSANSLRGSNSWPFIYMNQEAGNAFYARHRPEEDNSLQHTQIIQTYHPSYFVNYHPNDIQKRQVLLKSICKVCDALISNKSDVPRKIDILQDAVSQRLTVSNLNDMPTSFTGTEWLQDSLDIVMRLCFQLRHRLPTVRVEPGPFYCLEAWHRKWFERCSLAKTGSIDHARALLIPVFLDLNSCVRRTSFFLPIYEIQWGMLILVLESFTKELERTCYVLASGVESEEDIRFGSRCSFSKNVAEVKFNRMVCRAKELWESRPHHPKRTAQYVGFS